MVDGTIGDEFTIDVYEFQDIIFDVCDAVDDRAIAIDGDIRA